MKILIIAFEFPPEGGGIGTYAYQIAKNLNYLGIEATALALTTRLNNKEIQEFDKRQDFPIVRFKNHKFLLRAVFSRIIVSLSLMYKYKFDLIYVSQASAGIIGFLGRIIFKIPYIIVGHGTEILQHQRRTYIETVYKKSDMIIVNSNYTKHLFDRLKQNQKIRIVRPGGDHLIYNSNNISAPLLKSELGMGDKFVLMTVGSLSERKGHSTVLKAIKIIEKTCENIHYLIVGTGPLKNNLFDLSIEINIQDKITFYGYANINELPSLYNCCDVFVLNSTIDEKGDVEGFGIVLIEANLMGKPVIGSKDSGIEDAIEDGKSGILVPMDDPQSTAKAISWFYKNPSKCKKIGEYGRKRAQNNLTWLKSAEETKKIIEQMLNN